MLLEESCEYVRIERVHQLRGLDLDQLLYCSFNVEPLNFFTSLADYCIKHAYHGNSCICIQMDVLLPSDLENADVVEMGKLFMKEFAPDLPYCFYQYKAGKGRYLRFYISERQYAKEGFVDAVKCKRDVYVNDKGRLCSKNDKSGRLIRHKGDVIRSELCDWSVKTQLFMTNGAKFNALMQNIKAVFSDIFARFQSHYTKHVKLKKLNRRKAHNRFQQRNTTKINAAISRMEAKINNLAYVLKAGYFYDYYETDFHRIRNRYRTIVKNGKFNSGNIQLRFTMNTRWDVLDENLVTLEEKLDYDLQSVYDSLACDVLF